MNKELLDDIIQWDQVNWRKALPVWEEGLKNASTPLKCLELGGRQGGPSLWLALKGHQVVCSDIESPEATARPIHEKYELEIPISYQAIDATNIPYENEFDVIIFKSILGGITRTTGVSKRHLLDQMHKALKPGGKLLFAENLSASKLHQFMRKRFVKWGDWEYFQLQEMDEAFASYAEVTYRTVGFFGTFGRSETQRRFLGKLDNATTWMVPKKMRYIMMGVAKK